MQTDTTSHSAHPEWHSGGYHPGTDVWSSYTDYRWQCACGRRYDTLIEVHGSINEQHAAHLAEHAHNPAA